MVHYQLDMTKNWPAKMLWKAERTHDQEQDRQELLVLSKMEKQNKLHGSESVVSDSLRPPSVVTKSKLTASNGQFIDFTKQTSRNRTTQNKDIKFGKAHALNKTLKLTKLKIKVLYTLLVIAIVFL